MERPARRIVESSLVALLFATLGIAGLWYGAGVSLPPLASQHGAGIDAMLAYLLITVGGLFLVGYLTLAVLIWQGVRRARITGRVASRRAELGLSAALGLGMALIAEGGVLAIGIPVWAEYFGATAPAGALTIEVTAQQFMWHVRYPGADGVLARTRPDLIDDATNPVGADRTDPAGEDDVYSVNEITVPVNEPLRIVLRSRDVIHSFYLPHLRVKQDAVPGMVPEMVFIPNRVGRYELACAELCGLAHYRMQGTFNVVSQAEYDDWLRRQRDP